MSNAEFLEMDLSKIKIAKLLAKENITVEVDYTIGTAAFAPAERILFIPNWLDMPTDVIDLLIGHEVGHALYTPRNAFHQSEETIPGIPKMLVNIVEDARIEKLVLREYPGLIYNFKKGYKNLVEERDFFGIKGKNVNELTFLDRLNIFAKTRMSVAFTDAEKVLVDETMKTETFEEVLDVCRKILEFLENNPEETPESTDDNKRPGSGGSPQDSQGDQGDQGDQEGDQGDQGDQGDTQNDQGDTQNDQGDTQNDQGGDQPKTGSLQDNLRDSFTDNTQRKNEENLADKLHSNREKEEAKFIQDSLFDGREISSHIQWNHRTRTYTSLDNKLSDLKSVARKLSVEFNRRKAASESKKSWMADTGDINMKKLASYKFDDRIFNQKVMMPLGKNHGLFLLLDVSASMNGLRLNAVFKQSIIIAEFCKMNNIPFMIKGFTASGKNSFYDILDNRVPKQEYNKRIQSILNATRFGGMGGTPTIYALLESISHIKKFKEMNKIEKMSMIVLTDGEDNSYIPYGQGSIPYNNGKSIFKYDTRGYGYSRVREGIIKDIVEHISKTHNVNCTSFFVTDSFKQLPYSAKKSLTNKEKSNLRDFGFCESDLDTGYSKNYLLVLRPRGSKSDKGEAQTAAQLKKYMTSQVKKKSYDGIFASSFARHIA